MADYDDIGDNKDVFDQVFEFNDMIAERPLHFSALTHEQIAWTERAIDEEWMELLSARNDFDYVKMVDSVLDLVYFAVGTLHKMGVSPSQARACFNAIHQANMTKKKGRVAARGNVEEDAVKPEGFVPPDEAIALILSEAKPD